MSGPGSITTKEYAAARAAICAQYERADEVLESVEWELEHARGLALLKHPAVAGEGEPPVRVVRAPRTAFTPPFAVAFRMEQFGNDRKVAFLDVRISPDEDDNE